MSEAALFLSILALAALGLVGYLTYSLSQSVAKLAKELEKLAGHVESVDMNLERQHAALQALEQRVNAKPADPIQAILGMLPGSGAAKWSPIIAVVARGFATYLGKKAQQRSALKPRNVNKVEGASSEAPDQGGKV